LSTSSSFKTILRRLLLPALIGGYAANLAVFALLDAEGGASDWESVAIMVVVIFSGLLLAWPFFALLRRALWPFWANVMALLVLGTAVGALVAYVMASQIVPDTAADYIQFGLLVGPVAAILWGLFNFDALRSRSISDEGV
jgi:drug/metabolite transporter (DMT)-like permease